MVLEVQQEWHIGMFFDRSLIGTKLMLAGLMAGLMLRSDEWCRADIRNKGTANQSATRISTYQNEADALAGELHVLLVDFGAPIQYIPKEFEEKVRRWVHLYQTRDRPEIERILGVRHRDFEALRQQVASAHLPPDLAFATLVESHFKTDIISPDDNAGLWQFTRDTARRNGLRVSGGRDERLDPRKSTEAACRYLLKLQHEVGQPGSLMLALAAYNMGPGRLKQRASELKGSSRRADFWQLYRTGIFPAVTRTHLARLMAAILIGRNPQHYGFEVAIPGDFETVSSASRE
jgi:membrane-bound lytic murein transglycosylase D